MKKTFLLVVVTAVAILSAGTNVYAQSNRDVRSAKKEAKIAAKELKKDKFELLELGDLQSQLEGYLIKVKGGMKQFVGVADNCMSINLGQVTAVNNAANQYATQSGGMVKGRITSNTSNINGQQVDDIVAAYERLVLKEIKGEIQTSVTLVRKNKKNFDVRVYCLVDYDAAHAARMKAMRLALEELELTQAYGSKVSDWIDEGLKK